MKRIFATLSLLVIAGSTWAQDAPAANATQDFWADPINHPMLPFYIVSALIIVVISLILVVGFYMVRILNLMAEKAAEERAKRLGIEYKPQPSMMTKFWESINASVPVEQEKNIELDHNFDGIKELDNHLPPWWKWLFYGSIAWGAVYLVVYHVSKSLPLSTDEYQNEVALAEEQKRQFLASQPKAQIDENALTFTNDQAIIQKGKDIYGINCSPCHKDNGGGGIGPNLTDDYWLHGGDIKNIYGVIKNGVPEKGMVSWANVLNPEQIRDVAYFVMSIHGSNPEGAKGPQGTLFNVELPQEKKDSIENKAQASL